MDWIKDIGKTFVYITTGSLISAAIFITIFAPESVLTYHILWQIAGLSLICALGNLIFYSPREYGKKQMWVRRIIHYVHVNLVIIVGGYLCEWLETGFFPEILYLLVVVAIIYFAIMYLIFQKDAKIADTLNRKLSRRGSSEEDEN